MSNITKSDSLGEIAVIGIAGQFPKARNLDEFWNNLRNGVEAISFFTEEEARAEGLEDDILDDPQYVPAGGILDGFDLFDASFFGFTPREAEAMDPQHRFLLECAWEALENAGYFAENYDGNIGVYCGTSISTYMLANLSSNRELLKSIGGFQFVLSNDKDYSATNISFKLNLTGPSLNVQSACSTSLVSISLGCQGLLNYECDMALTGGASIGLFNRVGYMYQPGSIDSPDGHCRAFDEKAGGTVHGDGVGLVVLKRLEDAIEAGDYIQAIIKATALNNDGSEKIGYTAPGVDGQAEVIAMAQSLADVEPDSIDYIETHGTGTELGDPIEIAALTQAFRDRTDKKGYCAIGSVKSNIGHTFAAAGVAGFIKTVLALRNEEIPPSLHFEKPNPKIDFANSPFFVNTKLRPWRRNSKPRRAGVSSFGIGGTNAHIIVEEGPLPQPSGNSRPEQLLILSARTSNALDKMTGNLAEFLTKHKDINLADAAYTLQIGRKSFRHRKAVVCRDVDDAVKLLQAPEPKRTVKAVCTAEDRPVVFMFPGQGAQYANMSKDLYETEEEYRSTVNKCCEILKPHLDVNLLDILFPAEENVEAANEKLKQTAITQPALFVVEYALAKLWMSWGITPQVMIGHSIGEYIAACLADVFSLEDALALVAARGRLMQKLLGGSMLAVPFPESQVQPMLNGGLCIAAINSPGLCAVSGPTPEIEKLEKQLADNGMDGRPIHTSHAFHSGMMDDILEPFEQIVAKVKRSDAKIPYISNVTGTWITNEQIMDAKYWSQHLRNAVRFADGIQELYKEPSRVFLEVGPGRTLGTLTGMTLADVKTTNSKKIPEQVIITSLRHPEDKQPDLRHLLVALAKLWSSGVTISWQQFHQKENRNRLPLPTYHFERQRYWVEPNLDWLRGTSAGPESVQSIPRKADIGDWCYVPSWKRTASQLALISTNEAVEKLSWLVFLDEYGLGEQIVSRLQQKEQNVTTVRAGSKFKKIENNAYEINPRNSEDYDLLVKAVRTQHGKLERVLHLWSIKPATAPEVSIDNINEILDHGFYCLLFFAQALGNNIFDNLKLVTVINGGLNIEGQDLHAPENAILLGPGRVIDIEYHNIDCCTLDIVLPELEALQKAEIVEQIINEADPINKEVIVAYRRSNRWVQNWEAVKLPEVKDPPKPLREKGVYLITGGLGGIGLVFAKYLAQTKNAKLVLTGRSSLPPREEWANWLKNKNENNRTSAKIRKVQELEAAGAEVFIAGADVSNFDQMQSVFNEATARFGPLNGIIHAAGVPGSTITQVKTPEMAAEVLDPKVKGTLVLKALCKDTELDIFVLCSSIASVIGYAGQFDYGGANDFLDAFAHYENPRSTTHTVAINWDNWADVGMNVSDEIAAHMSEQRRRDLKVAILSTEGVDAFCRILNTDLNQVVVVTRDLQKIIEFHSQDPEAEGENDEAATDDSQEGKTKYSRPNLSNEYVAPTDDVEKALAEVWQDIFGIDMVGIHDDFYELGGHSLLAARLMASVREKFMIDLKLQTFFEKQTIAELAESILEKLVEKEDSETVEDILAEIEEG